MNVSTAAVFRSNGRIPFRLAMLLFAACAVATCGAASPVTPDQNQLDLLVQRLRAQNAQVSLGDAVPKSDTPYFSVTATRITVDAEQVFVFQYPTSEAAAADAAVVSPTGQPSPTVSIMWVGKPHFYRQDRLIVLYVGCTANLPRILEAALGPPFVVGAGLCPA